MDLWQYQISKKINRRIDDLTSVVFAFICYELFGEWPAVVYVLIDIVTRIFQFFNRKNKKIRVNKSARTVLVGDSKKATYL